MTLGGFFEGALAFGAAHAHVGVLALACTARRPAVLAAYGAGVALCAALGVASGDTGGMWLMLLCLAEAWAADHAAFFARSVAIPVISAPPDRRIKAAIDGTTKFLARYAWLSLWLAGFGIRMLRDDVNVALTNLLNVVMGEDYEYDPRVRTGTPARVNIEGAGRRRRSLDSFLDEISHLTYEQVITELNRGEMEHADDEPFGHDTPSITEG